MHGVPDGTPLHPTVEGGVSVPIDPDKFQMWLITGRFEGVNSHYREHLAANIHLEMVRAFPNRSGFTTGDGYGYHLLIQATEEELAVFLELYKRTVEIWGGDIRLSRKMLISDVRTI